MDFIYRTRDTHPQVQLTAVPSVGSGAPRVFLPSLSIADEPRFAWRGMHLDVCRHFFPVQFVKESIALLAEARGELLDDALDTMHSPRLGFAALSPWRPVFQAPSTESM